MSASSPNRVRADRIVVFSMHRSGSMLLHRLCNVLARQAGYKHYAPNGGDVQVTIRELADNPGHWLAQPGCFGPLRIYLPVPRMEEARVLLHLRDPRDVLVSMFFSYCYSHAGQIAGDTGYRRDVATRGIDDFVLRMATAGEVPVTGDYGTGSHLWDLAGNIRQRYETYISSLLGRPNVVYVKYKDMVNDPEVWLRAVSCVFGFDQREQIEDMGNLVSKFDVEREDQWSHRRQVAPGDYRRKLKPATIDELNHALGDVLTPLGFDSGGS